jgi:hypothetical protein
MAQSLSKIYVHLIFSTKDRERTLPDEIRPDSAVRSSRLMKLNLTSATCGTEDSRGLSGRREVAPVNPGHRPSASALGYALPARWAGFVRRSNP